MIRNVVVAVLLTGAFVAPATAAHADEPCSVYLHDHTPGVFPGGFHLHNDCLDK